MRMGRMERARGGRRVGQARHKCNFSCLFSFFGGGEDRRVGALFFCFSVAYFLFSFARRSMGVRRYGGALLGPIPSVWDGIWSCKNSSLSPRQRDNKSEITHTHWLGRKSSTSRFTRSTRRSGSLRRDTSREGSIRSSPIASRLLGGPCQMRSDPASSGPGRLSRQPPSWSAAATRSSSYGSQPMWG